MNNECEMVQKCLNLQKLERSRKESIDKTKAQMRDSNPKAQRVGIWTLEWSYFA